MIDSLSIRDADLRGDDIRRTRSLIANLEKLARSSERYERTYGHFPQKDVRRLLSLIHCVVAEHFELMDRLLPNKKRAAECWQANEPKLVGALASLRELQKLLSASDFTLSVVEKWENVFFKCNDGNTPYLARLNADAVINRPMFALVRKIDLTIGTKVVTTDATWIGGGSYANTFRFINPCDNEEYALKVARDDVSPEDLAAFKKEFDIIRSIDSEHVIRAYDAFQQGNAYTMELMDCSLEEYWQPGCGYPEGTEPRLEILEQVVSGVMDINSRGVWHRDLSPGNILIRFEEGRVIAKIADFGTSKGMDEVSSHEEKVVGRFNDREDLERVGFSHYGLPHEIYALTLLSLYILLRLEFIGHGGPNDMRKEYGGPLGTIMHKGLNDNAEDRYDNIQELWYDLLVLASSDQ